MVAKFRQETNSVTAEFRDALSLEAEELKADTAVQGSTEQIEAPAQALPEPQDAQPAASAGSSESAVVPSREPEPSNVAVADAGFSDSESRVAGPGWDSGNGSGASATPVDVRMAQLVPEDEEVEPTVLGGPVLMADEDSDSGTDGANDEAADDE